MSNGQFRDHDEMSLDVDNCQIHAASRIPAHSGNDSFEELSTEAVILVLPTFVAM